MGISLAMRDPDPRAGRSARTRTPAFLRTRRVYVTLTRVVRVVGVWYSGVWVDVLHAVLYSRFGLCGEGVVEGLSGER
jgi:hypothetical protein